MWGYAEIGERLARAGVPDHPGYATWIATYADPEFQDLAVWARGLADAAGADAGPGGRERMHAAFRASSEHELAFWDAAWRRLNCGLTSGVARRGRSRRIATDRPARDGARSATAALSAVDVARATAAGRSTRGSPGRLISTSRAAARAAPAARSAPASASPRSAGRPASATDRASSATSAAASATASGGPAAADDASRSRAARSGSSRGSRSASSTGG